MLEYRNVGFSMLIRTGEMTVNGPEKKQILEEEHLRVDDNFYRLCQIIQLIPQVSRIRLLRLSGLRAGASRAACFLAGETGRSGIRLAECTGS